VITLLVCPVCNQQILMMKMQYICQNCEKVYPINSGIIRLTGSSQPDEDYFPNNTFYLLFQSEEKNFWFRVRNRIITKMISRHVSRSSHILEVGCGTGFVSQYLKKKGYHIDCADIFPQALRFCRLREAGDNYFQYNLSERIFIEEYDGICAFDILEHIDDDESAIRNIHDALKPGGRVVITVPAGKNLWSAIDQFTEHKRRYSYSELKAKLQNNGFTIIKLSYFMTFLYPFILLFRKFSFLNRAVNDTDMKQTILRQAKRELQPGPIVNLLFYGIFSMEVPLIDRITLPFGSSLICVAKKKGAVTR